MRRFPRLNGLLLTSLGVFLGKLSIYDPWQQAAAGAPNLSLQMKGIILSISLSLLGLVMAGIGSAIEGPAILDPETRSLRPLGWLLAILVLLPGFGFYFWFEHQLGEMGYKF